MSALIGVIHAALVAVSSTPSAVAGQDIDDRGLAIVKEMDRKNRGFVDFEVELRMEIHDERGRTRVREMTVRSLESKTGDRTLIVLRRPADLAGTTFLSIPKDQGRRAQWIYLPTARRVRRIGGSQSSDAFLGSHFTYDDLTPPAVEGFDYRWVRDQEISGRPGALIERCDSACSAGLPRQLLWVDTDRYLLHRVDYFDADGVLQRTLRITDYRPVKGFWRASHMEMVDVESGGRTVLEWSGFRLGIGLKERDFEPARLGR
ncbi:MAG: outer membrane lipoprotein-sorting protein [Gemmatimonadota bacterium]|nr:MAG: outer membrane lipoprotein-sorting protein [Gemmatimonadota bacterium]